MKRSLKTLLLLLVIASLVVSVFACGGKKAPTGGDEGDEGTGAEEAFVDIYTDKWKGEKITISFNFLPTDEELDQQEAEGKLDIQVQRRFLKRFRQEFEEATGTTIVNRPVPAGEDYSTKMLAEIAAGVGPDIINFWPASKPSYMLKNILVPLSDYIDFTKPVYADSTYVSKALTDYYTWLGKIYAINKDIHSAFLYYNKERFENLGLEDPVSLWKKDQWTWDKFFEYGVAVTQDTNGDGSPDEWGFASWFYNNGFITSNGVEYVTYDEQGLPRFAVDEKYVRAREAADEMVSKYKMCPPVWWDPVPMQRMWNGETSMCYWIAAAAPDFNREMGEKVGIVCFPRGPDLPLDKKSRDQAETVGMGVTGCSKNPDLAALYLEWVFLDEEYVNTTLKDEYVKRYGSEEMYDYVKQWTANAAQLEYSGFGQGFVDAMNNVVNKPAEGTWMQAIEANRAACQAALDDFIISGGN